MHPHLESVCPHVFVTIQLFIDFNICLFQLYMERLWEVLTGDYPPSLPLEIPVITSLCFYALNTVFGRQARRAVRHFMPKSVVPYALDLVTTFQLMACSLENGQIRKHYGDGAYVLVMFSIGMWSYATIAGEASSNPCAHVIKYMQGKKSIKQLILHVVCQLVGGLMSFPYARLFWYLELTESHAHRFRSLHCTADLTVPTPIGFLLEFGATFVDVLLCLTTFTPFLFYEVATKSLIGCIVVILGVDLTGMYMNPINATNQTFGCRGINVLEHIFVYWVSVFLAGVLGVIMHKQLGQCWKMVNKQKEFAASEDIAIRGQNQNSKPNTIKDLGKGDVKSDFKDVEISNGSKVPVSEEENIEGEIFENIEDEVINDEAAEVTEDVIFQTAEDEIMKGEILDDNELNIPGNLNEVTRGQTKVTTGRKLASRANTVPADFVNNNQGVITDFDREYDEMRRQERLHNMANTNFDKDSGGGDVDITDSALKTRERYDARVRYGNGDNENNVSQRRALVEPKKFASTSLRERNGASRNDSVSKPNTEANSVSPALTKPSDKIKGHYDSRGRYGAGSRYDNTQKNVTETKSTPSIKLSQASSEESVRSTTKDTTNRHRNRSKSGSRIPVRAERKRSTSRSRIPVMKDATKKRSRLKSE